MIPKYLNSCTTSFVLSCTEMLGSQSVFENYIHTVFYMFRYSWDFSSQLYSYHLSVLVCVFLAVDLALTTTVPQHCFYVVLTLFCVFTHFTHICLNIFSDSFLDIAGEGNFAFQVSISECNECFIL